MASSRATAPPVNLKERIAALQQRNASVSYRATSPPPGSVPSTVQSAGGLREKIEKFERKGGVPVPRGRFGLGAPPPTEGQSRRQGELYGNRIPAPARNASGSGIPPLSRSGSPSGRATPSDKRRSFSLSQVEYDYTGDYSPLTSPSSSTPPESPAATTNESSASSPSSVGEFAPIKQPMPRGTTFATALEIARKAEADGADVFGVQEPSRPPSRSASSRPPSRAAIGDEPLSVEIPPPMPPAIIVSSDDPVTAGLITESPLSGMSEVELMMLEASRLQELMPKTASVDVTSSLESVEEEVHQPSLTLDKITSPVVESPPVVQEETAEEPKETPSTQMIVPAPAPAVVEEPKETSSAETVVPAAPIAPAVTPVVDVSPPAPAPEAAPPLSLAPVVDVSPPPPYEAASAPARRALPLPPVAQTTIPPVVEQPTIVSPTATQSPTKVKPLPSPPIRSSSSNSSISTPAVTTATAIPESKPTPKPTHHVPPSFSLHLDSPDALSPSSEGSATGMLTPSNIMWDLETSYVSPDGEPPSRVLRQESSTSSAVAVKEEEPSNHLSRDTTSPSNLSSGNASPNIRSRKSSLYLDVDLLKQSPSSPNWPRSALASSALEGTMSMNISQSDLVDDIMGALERRDEVKEEVEENVIVVTSPQSISQAHLDNGEPTDPQTLLSPLLSGGLLSPTPSFDSSSSVSGSRPVSMIETSPSRITLARRMTPATSRGVPVFVPATSPNSRKSDFVYFPPTPKAEDTEFGNVTVHKASHSFSHPRAYVSHYADAFDDNTTGEGESARPQTSTFSAVVHEKVRELPALPKTADATASSMRRFPETPKSKKTKRMTMMEQPQTPGYGELTMLLKEAVLLEDTLNKGELPSELSPREGEEEEERRLRERLRVIEYQKAARERKLREETNAREAEKEKVDEDVFSPRPAKDDGASARLRHTFLIPLSKARSLHKKEASAAEARKEIMRPKSAGIPDKHSHKSSVSHVSHLDLEPLPTSSKYLAPIRRDLAPSDDDKPPELPPKSPRSRFPSFRRLGSMSARSPTSNVRHSNSTSSEISSEDSAPAATPPDHSLEFTGTGEFGQHHNGHGMSWPSLSPKKSGAGVGRAASFAEKMWSRARTKSSTSTLSTYSGDHKSTSIPESISSIGPPPAISLPPLPTATVIPPSPDSESPRVIVPPTRSTSLYDSRTQPYSASFQPNSASISSTTIHAPTTAHPLPPIPQRDSLLTLGPDDEARPTSWISVSTTGSLPSPLFSQELFDAFPSVPEGTPHPPPGPLPHGYSRESSFPPAITPSFDTELLSSAMHPPSAFIFPAPRDTMPSAATPSFDQALLSSALHLSSAYKPLPTPHTPSYGSLPPTRAMTLPARRSTDTQRP
ncbi:hypothetical protein BDQ12DRAFT_686806 [Crucibulum laeve]|uniref:Uncharacterized protein n=1 Tax=Crucibulum laeve TaxID=68775 RepID=A0A5C3LT50_9AGAR|nr:hypothetical protein BDQ12DRAFT_686806 [Crucibulum laeve]